VRATEPPTEDERKEKDHGELDGVRGVCACRAGTTSAFNDGSPCTLPNGLDPALARLGWFDENSGGGTKPVRQLRPNAWGLYDMHGNVWEWCEDAVRDPAYRPGDPPGALCGCNCAGSWRALRGGCWFSSAQYCRSAFASGAYPSIVDPTVGFRLAVE
jgi:formylglycine-generating enzyme required for sulfatase activity